MLVSVIVPSYQQGIYIGDAIASLLEQRNEIEIFVYDSNSNDDTPKILTKFSDKISVIIEDDLGQAHAINKGLKECKGDVLCYLNSDDVLLPSALETVVECFENNANLDLLYGNAHYIDHTGSIIGDYRTNPWKAKRFYGECFICQPSAFWSRRVMNKIGLFDQKLQCSLDYDYWLRIIESGGRVLYIDEFLSCSRDYPQTKTRSLRGRVFRENFIISLRRLGRIDASWISQYLDYWKYERKLFFSSWIPSPSPRRELFAKIASWISPLFARDVFYTRKQNHIII